MAKQSNLEKNKRRRELIEFYEERRRELTDIIKDPEADYADKREAYQELAKRPRDASPTRHRRRCGRCGRARAHLRKFGMCRICVRELAHRGELPGVRKASW